MNKIIKLCYYVSIPTFLIFLLYNYALLPEQIGVLFDELGLSELNVTKSIFFYVSLGSFILSNGLFYAYQSLSKAVNSKSNDEFSFTFDDWVSGLSLIINTTFILLVLFVGIYYSRDINPLHYTFLIYLGPILLIAWFFYLVFLKIVQK